MGTRVIVAETSETKRQGEIAETSIHHNGLSRDRHEFVDPKSLYFSWL
jgi:hypothetical protein